MTLSLSNKFSVSATSQLSIASITAALALSCTPQVYAASAASADNSSNLFLEEIIVTARRKEESAQTTPVSLSAFTQDDLRDRGIAGVADLTASVPGINMSSSGGPNNVAFSIRGLSRGVVGNGQPAVSTYVNDVPLSTWGSNIPSYDVAQMQVLKGPQGTLFGRNSVTGAVLVNTAKPVYNLEGSMDVTLGSYAWKKYEGVINVPLIDDMLAIRVAAQLDTRNGYTKNLSNPGQDFDDRDFRGVRLSVLFNPLENLSNILVYQYDKTDANSSGIVPYADTSPGAFGAADAACLGVGPFAGNAMPDYCNITRFLTGNPREASTSLASGNKMTIKSVSNTTTFDLGSVTLKNILGYRTVFNDYYADIDGTDLPMIDTHTLVDTKQFSEEFQVSGSALNDTLSYIGGLFYLKQEPNGPNRISIQQFNPKGLPITTFIPVLQALGAGGAGSGDFYTDTSRAVFGQVTYKLSGIAEALAPLSLDLGARYTKDSQSVCSASGQREANPAISPGDCPAYTAPVTNIPSSQSSAKFHKTTYHFGVNYQATDKLLLYVVNRSGYRAGIINTPVFGSNLAPFQNAKPDSVNDIEVGMKSDWNVGGMQARWNVALFQDKYKDLQSIITTGSIPDPDGDGNPANNPSNNSFYANVGKATVKGIESELTLIPIDGLELSWGGSWLKKEITSLDIALPATLIGVSPTKEGIAALAFLGSPDYSYNLSAQYSLPLPASIGKISAGVRYFRLSKVAYGSVRAPASDKLDLRLDWKRVMSSSFDVSAFVTNAQDRAYAIGSGNSNEGTDINSAQYNEPRIYGMQVRYSFGR